MNISWPLSSVGEKQLTHNQEVVGSSPTGATKSNNQMSTKNKKLYYADAKININYVEKTLYISYYAYDNEDAKKIMKDKFRDNYHDLVTNMYDFKLYEK